MTGSPEKKNYTRKSHNNQRNPAINLTNKTITAYGSLKNYIDMEVKINYPLIPLISFLDHTLSIANKVTYSLDGRKRNLGQATSPCGRRHTSLRLSPVVLVLVASCTYQTSRSRSIEYLPSIEGQS
jgi:hypothetical protein